MEQANETGSKSGLTREQQIAILLPVMRKLMPGIIKVANAYDTTYPADKTPAEVFDAVTVAVPLRHFMVMAGICTNCVILDVQREQAATKTEEVKP